MRPLVIDSFAGGGGASEGIRAAIGRDPDYALNHDALALAMHRINHPGTKHIEEDVWHVDALGLCRGRAIGLLWMSPDCTDFSKAKGGVPRRKNIRGLAWVGLRWVKSLPKRQRPRVIALENVEEFQDWGPLLDDGKPCPLQRGAIFRQYVKAWRDLGATAVEYREIRASVLGTPTIRKRLYMIIRFDGLPIVWPEPTHGDPASEAVLSGLLKPWRTAAEIIDWSLPCPSIFDTAAEIKAKHGVRAIRPLAEATMARIAKGTMRYVVNSPRPFLVQINHGGGTGGRHHAGDEPSPTMTGKRGEAPVTPFVTKFNRGATGHRIDEPVHTITSAHSETHPGGYAPMGVVAPIVVNVANSKTTGRGPNAWPADEPARTVTQAGTQAVVAPFLAPRYQEKPGHEPRVRSVEEPAATIIGGANVPGHLVGACLVPRYGERPGQDPRARSIAEPAPVIVPTGNEGSLAAVSMVRHFGASIGSSAEEPVGTITAGGDGKAGVVAAFLAQHNNDARRADGQNPGQPADRPVSTITATGGQQGLVAAHLTHAYTSNTRGGEGDPTKPLTTIVAGGNHAAAVYAFLSKYYGEGLPSQPVDDPLHTVTAKPRHGVVTVTIQGQPYAIVDIGMRMLTPRERFNAQGFRRDYVIDRGELEDGTIVPLTLEQQGRMCGNSVCPPVAEALIRANCTFLLVEDDRPAPVPAAMPLFAAE